MAGKYVWHFVYVTITRFCGRQNCQINWQANNFPFKIANFNGSKHLWHLAVAEIIKEYLPVQTSCAPGTALLSRTLPVIKDGKIKRGRQDK